MSGYPKESKSQEIGRKAVNLFCNEIPSNWIYTELDGDSDYGLDFMIQYKEIDLIKYKFHIQLKGTENNSKITENEIKIQVKTSTLNYYKNMGLVLFVICDLNKKECYYEYMHDILDGLNLTLNQNTHTIKVPIKNILDSNFEIKDILEKWAKSNHDTHKNIVSSEKEKNEILEQKKETINMKKKITIDFYTGIK